VSRAITSFKVKVTFGGQMSNKCVESNLIMHKGNAELKENVGEKII